MPANDTAIAILLQTLVAKKKPQAMPQVVTPLMNVAMRLEGEQFLGAGHYERGPDRRGYANGTKPKMADTLAGTHTYRGAQNGRRTRALLSPKPSTDAAPATPRHGTSPFRIAPGQNKILAPLRLVQRWIPCKAGPCLA